MVVDMEAKEERKEEGQGQEQGQGQGEEGVKPEELKPKLNDKLVKGLEELGIQRLLPIQVKTWRTLLGGKRRVFDLRLCSPTGSGKTLAYALPILHHLSQQQLSSASARLLRCIVILPTRDLAQQVHSVLAPLASRVHVKVGLCCGLASLEEEATQYERERERELEDEHGQNRDTLLAGPGPGPGPGPIQTTGASILVATPGRLRSHLDRRTMNLLGLQFLVLDEMDRLLQQSYHECLPVLLDQYQKANVLEEENAARKMGLGAAQFMQPKYKCMDNRLIKLSVSATITNDSGVKTAKLREGFVRTVSGFRGSTSSSHGRTAGRGEKYELPENLEEFMLICSKEKKPFALLDLLKKVKRQRTLCFANATEASELIHTLVTSSQGLDGWHCEVYNSKRRNHERGAALKSFGSQQDQEQGEGTKGDVNKLLICTDGASRGIDLKRVKLVINYDMPTSTKKIMYIGLDEQQERESLAQPLPS